MSVLLPDSQITLVEVPRWSELTPFWILGFWARRSKGIADLEQRAIAETGVIADVDIVPAYRSEADASTVAVAIMRMRSALRVFVCPGDDSWGPTFSPIAHIDARVVPSPPESGAGDAG